MKLILAVLLVSLAAGQSLHKHLLGAEISADQECLLQSKAQVRKSNGGQCQSSLTKQLGRKHAGQICQGPFTDQRRDALVERRVALVLRGEAFRGDAGQFERHITVTPESWKNQREASMSHVTNVVEPLEACGFTVDVFIETYKMELDKKNKALIHSDPERDLASFYDRRVTSVNFLADHDKQADSNQVANYARALQLVVANHKKTGVTYDGFLVTRLDVIFKKSVPDLEGVDWAKILFAFHEWEMGGGRPGNSPQRIPDTVVWFPWAYVNCAVNAGFGEHNWWAGLDHVMPNHTLENRTGFMINEFHDANSMIDRNPLYKLVRPEQEFDVHGGFAVLVAGVNDRRTIKEFVEVRDHLLKNVKQQGDPPLVPSDFYVHHWAQNLCMNGSYGWPWVQSWAAKDGFASCGNYAEISRTFHGLLANKTVKDATLLELFAWGYSLLNGVKRMQSIQRRNQFTYDVVFVARDDYVDMNNHSQLMVYNLSKAHAGFDGTVSAWVPSVLILSSNAVGKLAASVEANFWPALHSEDGSSQRIKVVMEWIEHVTGMPVVTDATEHDLPDNLPKLAGPPRSWKL